MKTPKLKKSKSEKSDNHDRPAVENAGKNRVSKSDVAALFAECRGLERDNLFLILRDAQRSRRLGLGGIVFGIASFIVAGVVFLRAEQPAPDFLWQVNSEGVPTQITTIEEQQSYGEVWDAYWASRFVRAYESYEWNTIQSDWNAVGLMSSPDVARQYREKVRTGQNALLDTLGQRYQIRVEIRSTIIDQDSNIATVRFSTIRRNLREGYDEPPRHWTARFGYSFNSIPTSAENRTINPLGYQVSGYRVYQEDT